MKTILKLACAGMLGLGLDLSTSNGQTDGGARFEGTINDYNGTGTAHWTVAWVTTESGTFIKTLRKQGPTITASHWSSHCGVWYNAKAGSTALDGYSSATAANYSGTNSPVIWTWDCRDANFNLVADGSYKFWIQYAEDSGQGPHTTNGMLWVKGPAAVSSTYPNIAANITNLKVVWTPAVPTRFTSLRVSQNNLVMSGTGPANRTCYMQMATNVNQPTSEWGPVATNSFDSTGNVSFTNAVDWNVRRKFYRLQVP